MADVNRAARPLSPHVSIYRFPLNGILSIMHRITGVAMAASSVLIIWWFMAAATSESAFSFINGLMTSWLGIIVLTLSAAALWFHFMNGIRHLIWDTGAHFGQRRVYRSGIVSLVAAAIMLAITLFIA